MASYEARSEALRLRVSCKPRDVKATTVTPAATNVGAACDITARENVFAVVARFGNHLFRPKTLNAAPIMLIARSATNAAIVAAATGNSALTAVIVPSFPTSAPRLLAS